MQPVHRILVVEDEVKIRKVVTTYLTVAGYDVTAVADGLEGLSLALENRYDLIVLDLNLPGLDGMQVAAQVSAETDSYIIMLTARGEETDRISGLTLGADDYITKPFSPRELVARVQARLRRSATERASIAASATTLQLASLNIDLFRHQVITHQGDTIDLTVTEFKLLHELASHDGYVLSREQLLERVWQDESNTTSRVVDVFVNQVRRKLEQALGKPLIETVRGVGYRFVDA